MRSVDGIAESIPHHDHLVAGLAETNIETPLKVVSIKGFRVGASIVASPVDIFRVLSEVRPEVVHIHGALHPVYLQVALICRARRVPVVLSPRSAFMLEPDAALHRKVIRRVAKRLLDPMISALHGTSDDEMETLSSFAIEPHLLPNVLPSCAASGSSAKGDFARSGYLLLGRVSKRKNPEAAIRAWMSLPRPLREDQPFVVAGDTPCGDVDPISAELREAATNAGVQFVGHVSGERKRCLIEGSRVLVHPSKFENFGHSIGEAMTAGLAVVVGPSTPFSHPLRATSGGVVVEDPTNPTELAGAMIEALSQPVDRRGFNRILSNYSADALAHGYDELYLEAASSAS